VAPFHVENAAQNDDNSNHDRQHQNNQ